MRLLFLIILIGCEKHCYNSNDVDLINQQISQAKNKIDSLTKVPFNFKAMNQIVSESNNIQLLIIEKENLVDKCR